MASWTLAPCLKQLFKEFDLIAPSRDHASDGSIGDEAHQETHSDHNPDSNGYVCAIDVDNDLRAEITMEDVVQYLLSECRKANNVGKDYGRLNYIIYNRRIWRADNNWVKETYTGSNPHDKHAHFSCEHNLNYVRDVRGWGLLEEFEAMDQNTFNKLMDTYLTKVSKQGTTAPYNQWETSPLARLVTDHQDMPAPLLGSGVKDSLWRILEAIQKDLIVKNDTDEDLLEHLTVIQNKLDQVIQLFQSHVSGIIEGVSK